MSVYRTIAPLVLDLEPSYNDKLLEFRLVQTFAPLVTELFFCCLERDFMDFRNHENQADDLKAFNSTSGYISDLLNLFNPYLEGMVNQVYPPELKLNNANTINTEAPF